MHAHSYWIGIMAIAFVIAMAAWLLLVFNADRHPSRKTQESTPHRDVIGGEFSAREGGRQLMPHPNEPDPEMPDPGTPDPGAADPGMPAADVPEPRQATDEAAAKEVHR